MNLGFLDDIYLILTRNESRRRHSYKKYIWLSIEPSGDLGKDLSSSGCCEVVLGCFTLCVDVFGFGFEAHGKLCWLSSPL